ncbi:MAG: putative transcriptional regulator [Phycisphaerales bacterium]|jgi:predicted transcriptional regulator
MTIVRTRNLAAIALSLLGLVAAPAAAQDGMRLARECVQRMQEITGNHVEQDQGITRRTIKALRQADEEGAPDRVLRSIAGNGVKRIDAITLHGHTAIHETAFACVRKLKEIGASDQLIQTVRRVAMASNEKLNEAAHRSKQAIREALERALG